MVGPRQRPTSWRLPNRRIASMASLILMAILAIASLRALEAQGSSFTVRCTHYFTSIERTGNSFVFGCKDGLTETEDVRAVSTITWMETQASSPMNITCPANNPVQSRVTRRDNAAEGFVEWEFSCKALAHITLSCSEPEGLTQGGTDQMVLADEPAELVRVSSADLDAQSRPVVYAQVCDMDCADGYQFDDGNGACVCPPGSFRNTTAPNMLCTLCPLDTFNGNRNQVACQACAPGTYTPDRGARSCSPCTAGNFLDPETHSLKPCPQGHQCFNCNKKLCDTANTYQDEKGQSSCKGGCTKSVTYNRTTCAEDTTPPVITISDERVTGDILVHDRRLTLPVINATAFDAFDGPLNVTQSKRSDKKMLVLQAEDNSKNIANEELRVLSPNETRPIILVNVDISVPLHVELGISFTTPHASVEDLVDRRSSQLRDAIVATQEPSVDANMPGTYLVTYSLPVANSLGLFAENVTLTVEVSDTIPPVAVATDGPLHMEAQDPLVVDALPDVVDASNVSITVLSNLSQLLPSSVPALIEVSLLLNDTAGNTDTVAQEYLIQDTRPPTFASVPAEVYLCDGAVRNDVGDFAVRHTIATDAWDSSVTVVFTEPVALNPQMQYLVVLNATDSSGNSATTTADMNQPPSIPVTAAVVDWTTGSLERAPTLPDSELTLQSFAPAQPLIPVAPSCPVDYAQVSEDITGQVPIVPSDLPPWFPAERAGTFLPNQPVDVVWETCSSDHDGASTLYVQDTSLPIIHMAGDEVMAYEVEPSPTFMDPGVRVQDAWYGDVSDFACVSVVARRLLEAPPRSVQRSGPFASLEEAKQGYEYVDGTSSQPTGGLGLIASLGRHGVYTFTLEYTVSIGVKNPVSATRAVVPVDTRPPTITWHVSRVEWPFGFSALLRAGIHFSAWDAADGDVGTRVNASSLAQVRPRQPGAYNVTASVSDRAGNAAHQNFTVIVKPPSAGGIDAGVSRLGVLLSVPADAVDALDAAAYQDWLALAPLTAASSNVHDGETVLGTGAPDGPSIAKAEHYGVAASLADVWVVHNASRVQVHAWMHFPALVDGPGDADSNSTLATSSTRQPSTSWDNGRPTDATPGSISTAATAETVSTPNGTGDADLSVPSTTPAGSSTATSTGGNGTGIDSGRSISTPTGSASTMTTTAAPQGQTAQTDSEGERVHVLLEVVAHNSTTAAVVDPVPSATARVVSSKVARPEAPFFHVAIRRLEEIQAVLAATTTTTTTITTTTTTTTPSPSPPRPVTATTTTTTTGGAATTPTQTPSTITPPPRPTRPVTTSATGIDSGSTTTPTNAPTATGRASSDPSMPTGSVMTVNGASPTTASVTTSPSPFTTSSSSAGSAAPVESTTSSDVNAGGSKAGSPVVPIAAGAGGGVLLLCLVVIVLALRRRRERREPKFTNPKRELTGIFANPLYKTEPTQEGQPPDNGLTAWDEPAMTPEERAFHDRRWNQSHYDIHAPTRDYLEPVVGGAEAQYATPTVQPYGNGNTGADDGGSGDVYSRPLVFRGAQQEESGRATGADGQRAFGNARAPAADESPYYSLPRGEASGLGLGNPAFVGMRSTTASGDDGEWDPPFLQSEYVEPPSQLQQTSDASFVNATYENAHDAVALPRRSNHDAEVDA